MAKSKYESHVAPRLEEIKDRARNGATDEDIAFDFTIYCRRLQIEKINRRLKAAEIKILVMRYELFRDQMTGGACRGGKRRTRFYG